jgi:hypothetical protein
MTPLRPFGWVDALSLLVILAIAGGVRGGYLWYCAEGGRTSGICRVQEEDAPPHSASDKIATHDSAPPSDLAPLVHNIETRQWYGCKAPFAAEEEATAHYSPGYPYLLGWLGRIVGGTDRVRVESIVRWSQCGLGAITAGLYFLFARRAFRSLAVGAIAGLAVALDPFAIFNVAEVQDGVVTSFLVAVVLFLGTRASQAALPLGSLCYGLALAGLALVRAACLPFAFVALVWYLLRCRTLTRGWLCATLAFLGFVNGLAPWMVRNLQTFGEPLPIVDSLFLHLWIGNNPAATGGRLTISAVREAPTQALQEIPGPQQPRRYDRLAPLVVDQIRGNPLDTMRRRLAAAGYFLLGEQFFVNHRLAERSEPRIELTLLGVVIGVIPLAFIGWRWSYGWRRESMPAALAVFWLPLPYILGHAEWLHGPRLPLDGLLTTFAAFGLLCLIPGLGKTLRQGYMQTASAEFPEMGPSPLPALPATSPAGPGAGRGPSWR